MRPLHVVGLVALIGAVAVAFHSDRCFDCDYPNIVGPCCSGSEMCPGQSKCCDTCPSGVCGCTTNCTPQCTGKQCGPGGCSKHDCGTCGEGKGCNSDGQCVESRCFDCNGATGPCCSAGQLCSDGSPCCGSCPSGNCGCNTFCQPNCTGLQCGFGGCSDNDCGSCGPNAQCNYDQQCQCKGHCQCNCGKGKTTTQCPASSEGCAAAGCTCLGPRQPTTVSPIGFYSKVETMYQCCCYSNGGMTCGGYLPVNLSAQPVTAAYYGDKGCGQSIILMMFFAGVPTTVDDLYLSFGTGSVNTCGGLSFQLGVSNCSKTDYTPCCATDNCNATCFSQDPKGCKVLHTVNTVGNGTGVWFKNPKVSTFTIYLSVGDDYYQDSDCGNSAVVNIFTDDVVLSY